MIQRLVDLRRAHDHYEADLFPFAASGCRSWVSLSVARANTLRSRWPVVPRDAASRIAATRRFGCDGVLQQFSTGTVLRLVF